MPSSQKEMSPGGIARSLMNTLLQFLVIMSPVVTSAKLLSSVIVQSAGSRVSHAEDLYNLGRDELIRYRITVCDAKSKYCDAKLNVIRRKL